jgi:hypothetical protein
MIAIVRPRYRRGRDVAYKASINPKVTRRHSGLVRLSNWSISFRPYSNSVSLAAGTSPGLVLHYLRWIELARLRATDGQRPDVKQLRHSLQAGVGVFTSSRRTLHTGRFERPLQGCPSLTTTSRTPLFVFPEHPGMKAGELMRLLTVPTVYDCLDAVRECETHAPADRTGREAVAYP